MAYTTTETTGYGKRIGNAFGGIIGGIVLILAGTGVLWWNEGNFVKTRAALNDAQGAVEGLGDINTVDSSKNAKLVHATGPAATKDVLKDADLGILVDNAIRLDRKVEYYQWVEDKKTDSTTKTGGSETKTTTYTYKEEWTDKPVDSSKFSDPDAPTRNKNTQLVKYEDSTTQAADVTFGAYRLPKFLVDKITGAESVTVDSSNDALAKLNERLSPPPSSTPPAITPEATNPEAANPEAITTPEAPAPPEPPRMVHVSGDTVYLGQSPNAPRVGDVRIKFTKTPAATVSLVAKVNGDTFEVYRAKNDRTVSLLSVGTHSAENMFGAAHAGNSMSTWMWRGVGIFAVCIGLMLVLSPLQVLASVIPFLGNIVGVGTTLFGLLAGLAWSFFVISLAWLFNRPEIGIPLLAVAVVCVWLLVSKVRAWKNTKAQQPVKNRAS